MCSAGNIALLRTVILRTTWPFFLTWIFLGTAINCFILKVLLRTLPSMFLTPNLTHLCAACLLWNCLSLWSDTILAIIFFSHLAQSYYQSRRGNFLILLKRFWDLQAVAMIQCLESSESVKSVASFNDVSSISLEINRNL